MAGKLFIISAPSGTGKTTLVNHLIERLEGQFSIARVLTYTTKAPRPQEQHGKDYYFVSQAEFEAKIAQDFFMEWSNAYGHYYGSPRSIMAQIQQGASFILIADRAGARQIRQQMPECVLIWLYTASIQVLQERLMARATDGKHEVTRRLELAKIEVQEESQRPMYQFHVCNDDFFKTLEKLHEIVCKYL